jgi:imidazolonepropionase-like amidohydrolase
MPAVTVFLAQENARKTLEAGVTTVRDLGAQDYTDIAMRDLINRGAMRGPRMFVAGYGLQVTKEPAKPGFVTPEGGRADGVAEVLRVVQQQVAAGADVIKMYGSTGSDQDVSGDQTFTFEEMKAAVDAAHQAGKRIAIHSYGPAGARDAVRAGADSVEHATDMDDETIAEMARRKTFYVPTIDHNRYYVENREQFGYGKDVADRLNAYRQRNLDTARRAHKAGVRFAMGSERGIHDVRPEHARAGLVREGWDDTGRSSDNRHDPWRGASRNGEEPRGGRTGILCRHRGPRGRPAGGHRCCDPPCAVGDESGRGRRSPDDRGPNPTKWS